MYRVWGRGVGTYVCDFTGVPVLVCAEGEGGRVQAYSCGWVWVSTSMCGRVLGGDVHLWACCVRCYDVCACIYVGVRVWGVHVL